MVELQKIKETIERTEFILNEKEFELFKILIKKELCTKKLEILNMIFPLVPVSLEEINKKTKMSFPLISYHTNGNIKSHGLIKYNLVKSLKIPGGQIGLLLTEFGKTILELIGEEN